MQGRTIGGYEITREIARGGMGVVYAGRHPRDGRIVAIKVLPAAQSHQQRRFLTEVQALTRLRHEHVVHVHDAGEANGHPFLVMDLIEGESLQDRLDRHGELSAKEAARIVLKIARGLEHAHAQGILHRDVKPANVLLNTAGEPCLTDFGLAKDLSASRSGPTQSGTFLGTPGYWPPEQAQGQLAEIGPHSDVYSLGATLYALLTREPPVQGDSLVEIMAATVSRAPDPPSHLRPNLPPALEAVCLKCLEKDPARRYPTADALAEDLERFLAGEPVAAAPNPTPRGAIPFVQVAGLRSVLLAVGAGLCLAGGLVFWLDLFIFGLLWCIGGSFAMAPATFFERWGRARPSPRRSLLAAGGTYLATFVLTLAGGSILIFLLTTFVLGSGERTNAEAGRQIRVLVLTALTFPMPFAAPIWARLRGWRFGRQLAFAAGAGSVWTGMVTLISYLIGDPPSTLFQNGLAMCAVWLTLPAVYAVTDWVEARVRPSSRGGTA